DKLFAHVFLDPLNPPEAIMLQWFTDDHVWDHRAFWGPDLIYRWATRTRMGPLPTHGKWVRLEVPCDIVGIKPGQVVRGWACAQCGGGAWWDCWGVARKGSE